MATLRTIADSRKHLRTLRIPGIDMLRILRLKFL